MTTELTLTIDGDVECEQIIEVLERGGLRPAAFQVSDYDQNTEEN